MRRWMHVLWVLPAIAAASAGATIVEMHHIAAEQRATDIENAAPPLDVTNRPDLQALDEAAACMPLPASFRLDQKMRLGVVIWTAWAARLVRDPDLSVLERALHEQTNYVASMTEEAQRRNCNEASSAASAMERPLANIPALPPPSPLAQAPDLMKDARDQANRDAALADRERALDDARREGFAAGQMAQQGMDEARAAETAEREKSAVDANSH
jgi:hypothetical protein